MFLLKKTCTSLSKRRNECERDDLGKLGYCFDADCIKLVQLNSINKSPKHLTAFGMMGFSSNYNHAAYQQIFGMGKALFGAVMFAYA